jgi:cytochrome c
MHPTPLYILTICLVVAMFLNACGDDKSSATQPSSGVKEGSTSSAITENKASTLTQPTTQISESNTASDQTQQNTTAQAGEAEPAPIAQTSEFSQQSNDDPNRAGLELAKNSGCLACHAIDRKVVGPSWKDVAKRYASDPNAKSKLIMKISKGGRGNWTELVGNVAMPPYSPRVSDDNIAKLVEFVLSLKDQ